KFVADLIEFHLRLRVDAFQHLHQVFSGPPFPAFEADPQPLHVVEAEGGAAAAERAAAHALFSALMYYVQMLLHEGDEPVGSAGQSEHSTHGSQQYARRRSRATAQLTEWLGQLTTAS